MVSLAGARPTSGWRGRIYLPGYRTGEAARYAGTSAQTVSAWRRQAYSSLAAASNGPVRGRGHKLPALSYLELIEVAFVATLRHAGFSLRQIRAAHGRAANAFDWDYPFVDARWKSHAFDLMENAGAARYKISDVSVPAYGEASAVHWHEYLTERFEEFDYEDGLAVRWHPRGRNNSVIIDPRIRFGVPSSGGVITVFIKGRYEAGESLEDIEDDLGLSPEQVKGALAFEAVNDAAV